MDHLAFVNAVLGGLAFVFLGALITIDKNSNVIKATLIVASMAAACFLMATIGATLLAGQLEAFDAGRITSEQFNRVGYLRPPISKAFLAGVFFLLISVGLLGWIRSRFLGIITTIIAFFTGLGSWYMIKPFIN